MTDYEKRLEALRLAVAFCVPSEATVSSDVVEVAEEFYVFLCGE